MAGFTFTYEADGRDNHFRVYERTLEDGQPVLFAGRPRQDRDFFGVSMPEGQAHQIAALLTEADRVGSLEVGDCKVVCKGDNLWCIYVYGQFVDSDIHCPNAFLKLQKEYPHALPSDLIIENLSVMHRTRNSQ